MSCRCSWSFSFIVVRNRRNAISEEKNIISDKEKLSNILGIEFNDRIIIKRIESNYTEDYYTHLFLYVQVDNKYANQISYFRDNGYNGFKEYYANYEKTFYENLDDPNLAGHKIMHDNSVFPSGVDINLLPKARGVEGHCVLVFGIDGSEDETYKEFLVWALIPAKLEIKLQPV